MSEEVRATPHDTHHRVVSRFVLIQNMAPDVHVRFPLFTAAAFLLPVGLLYMFSPAQFKSIIRQYRDPPVHFNRAIIPVP